MRFRTHNCFIMVLTWQNKMFLHIENINNFKRNILTLFCRCFITFYKKILLVTHARSCVFKNLQFYTARGEWLCLILLLSKISIYEGNSNCNFHWPFCRRKSFPSLEILEWFCNCKINYLKLTSKNCHENKWN